MDLCVCVCVCVCVVPPGGLWIKFGPLLYVDCCAGGRSCDHHVLVYLFYLVVYVEGITGRTPAQGASWKIPMMELIQDTYNQ